MEYEDIIDTKYPFASSHKKMSMLDRAAQFAAFSALTGYDDAIYEANRLTEDEIKISDDTKNDLDEKLSIIANNLKNKPKIEVMYFVKDKYKTGGKYIKYEGNLIKIDKIKQTLNFEDKTKIDVKNIINLNIK